MSGGSAEFPRKEAERSNCLCWPESCSRRRSRPTPRSGSLREGVLLALVAVLEVIAALLVRRDRLTDQRLAAERRQLSIAVNNIPQGLVLYDASARIIICNQPYLDMFGLSPDVAKPGCTMQRLIAHRKETGSFDGDVDEFCKAIIKTVSLGKATRQLTEAPGGRAIEIINRPLKSGRRVVTIEDITERRRADEKIAHLAHYDGLTEPPELDPVPPGAGTVAQGNTAGRASAIAAT